MNSKWNKPLRLVTWDYSQPAIYHITICTSGRLHLLGAFENDSIVLSRAGEMVESHLLELPTRFPTVNIDSHVIMPNHIHFIVEMNMTQAPSSWIDLSRPIQALKSMTTVAYSKKVQTDGWPRFNTTLWQRRYFETIVRDERSQDRHRQYIASNPANWSQDPEAFHERK